MKIIILGAGQVGSSVAAALVSEANDITVVDSEGQCLQALQDRLDLRTVVGHASHPDVLKRAGAEDADMILAVTNSDETNMVACQVAYTLFHTPTKIARVRARDYLNHPQLFTQEALPVDVLISPEQVVIDYVQRLIEHPGALQVLDFAGGRVQLVAVRAYYGGPLVGHELRELRNHMPGVDTRVAAIFRRGKPIIPEGSTVIEADDEVFFIAARNLPQFRIESVTANGKNNFVGNRLHRLSLDYRLNFTKQHFSIKRFGDVIVGANVVTLQNIFFQRFGREKNHRNIPVDFTDFAADGKSVDVGQHHIQDTNLKVTVSEPLHRIFPVINPGYFVIVQFEIRFQYRPETQVVFH